VYGCGAWFLALPSTEASGEGGAEDIWIWKELIGFSYEAVSICLVSDIQDIDG
jgi:hypothetical protein